MPSSAERLREHALATPEKKAFYFPVRTDVGGAVVYESKTFREVDGESDAYARGFKKIGITRGTKTILMVKSSPELFSIIFALFKLGAVPVIVDPGMGIPAMLACYESVGAEAFIGIPVAHIVRLMFRTSFTTLNAVVTVGYRWFWGGHSLADIAEPSPMRFPIEPMHPDELVIINFTTGSTGPRKGVECTQKMVDAMLRPVSVHFKQSPEDVSLVTIPFVGLINLLLGSSSVLAPMDATKPALADPQKIASAIDKFQVTHMFASPALLHRLAVHGADKQIRLPSLRIVISGGAPVSLTVLETFQGLLDPAAQLHATYGATEALPIASIESREIGAETRALTGSGAGTCVGRPMDEIEVRIIRISDAAIAAYTDELLVPRGEVGELIIRGPVVSTRYHQNPDADTLMKIPASDGSWHRSGDLGWFDESGRIWFCGRKSERVETRRRTELTGKWEGIFDAHPEVYRSALVGVGKAGAREPVMCIELNQGVSRRHWQRIKKELFQVAAEHALTQNVHAILLHRAFPVDIRHNAKIGRDELGAWAEAQLGKR